MKQKCNCCGRVATWQYDPGIEMYCDAHVPRSCSCNFQIKAGIIEHYNEHDWPDNPHEDYEELRDAVGRLLPCIEYSYNEDGWDEAYLPVQDDAKEIAEAWLHKHHIDE